MPAKVFDLVMQDAKGNERILHYDPYASTIHWADTGLNLDLPFPSRAGAGHDWEKAFPVSPTNPAPKSRSPSSIKIQLGLKCNYSCSYCNQRAQPHDGEANPKRIDWFLKKMPQWFDCGSGQGLTLEFWGGEPFVYWKTLKPLAEGLRALYPQARFNIITNGSLLDREKVDWLYDLGFSVGISHDGPSYETNRGQDPFKNPTQRKWIRYAYDRLFGERRIGFNCVLTNKSTSLVAVRTYLSRFLGVPPENIPLTTEEILLPYDEGGMSLSLLDGLSAKRLTHTVFFEAIRGMTMGIGAIETKTRDLLQSLANRRPASSLGQKCGMDKKDEIAIDLNGNAMTCQNTSPLTKHRIGHLEAFDAIKLDTAHHWSTRSECRNCPVIQMCRGACLFLEDELWQQACDNSLAYNLGLLAASLYFATRMVLVRIEGDDIRHRGNSLLPVIEPGFLDAPLPDWYFEQTELEAFRRTA